VPLARHLLQMAHACLRRTPAHARAALASLGTSPNAKQRRQTVTGKGWGAQGKTGQGCKKAGREQGGVAGVLGRGEGPWFSEDKILCVYAGEGE